MGADRPKQFLELAGRPILSHTLDMLTESGLLAGIFLVVPSDFVEKTRELVEGYCRGSGGRFFHRPSPFKESEEGLSISVIAGGAERQDSVYNGLTSLPPDCGFVMIHDGVRPFASRELLINTLDAASKTGAAIAAMASTDTVKRVKAQRVIETLEREQIWLVQTPQVFRKDIILKAYDEARKNGWVGTDDASFVERLGIPVSVVRGEKSNIKVTTPQDLAWAGWFLAGGRTVSCDSKPAGGLGEK